jgi:ABC-type antimicrobial peptide transport system permease subunit
MNWLKQMLLRRRRYVPATVDFFSMLGTDAARGRTFDGVDNNIPAPSVQTVNESLSWFTTEPRFRSELVGVFSVLTFLLAAVGIYGVLSQRVSQRTQEMGIRIALGARRDDLLMLVIGEGIRLTLVGIAIGVACSFVLGRFLSSMRYGIKATDPVTLFSVSALLASVALLACYIPAQRAMRMNPVAALHCA